MLYLANIWTTEEELQEPAFTDPFYLRAGSDNEAVSIASQYCVGLASTGQIYGFDIREIGTVSNMESNEFIHKVDLGE